MGCGSSSAGVTSPSPGPTVTSPSPVQAVPANNGHPNNSSDNDKKNNTRIVGKRAVMTALVKFLAVARLGAVADRNALIAFNPTTDDKASKNYKAYCRDLMRKSGAMHPRKQNVLTAADFDFVIMPDPLEGKDVMLFFAVLDKKFGLHFDSANLFDDFKNGFYNAFSATDIRAAEAEGAVHNRSQDLLNRLSRQYGSPDASRNNNATTASAASTPQPPITPTPPPSDSIAPKTEFGKRPRDRPAAASGGWGSGGSGDPPPPPSSSLPPPTQAVAVSPTGGDGPKFGRRHGAGAATGAFGSGTESKAPKKPFDKYEAAEVATTAIQELKDIPALEEQETDDYTDRIQHAPNVRSKQVQTLSDLDGPGGFNLPSSTADGFDLSALTAAFAPKEKINEADVMWDFDSLFSQLSSEMQSEEGEEEEGEFTIAPKMEGPLGSGAVDKKEEKKA